MTWSAVLQCEVLVGEGGTVDGHTTSSRVVDHISSETQKSWHDTVEHGALIGHIRSCPDATFTFAERDKTGSCARDDVSVHLYLDTEQLRQLSNPQV